MNADLDQLKKIIEGAVLASAKPISYEKLLGLFDEDARPNKSDLVDAFNSLQQDYEGRGIELQEVASGLRFQVSQNVTTWVARLQDERPQRYSRALLETIAIIAYRQPVTRGGIEDVRGVAVSTHIIKTLQEREWVRVVGHLDVPGRPALYATTRQFLDYFNLKNLNDLPPLSDIKDLEQLNGELDLADDVREKLLEMVQQEHDEALGLIDAETGESIEAADVSESGENEDILESVEAFEDEILSEEDESFDDNDKDNDDLDDDFETRH